MKLAAYRAFWKRVKPYTIRSYRTDAEDVLRERLEFLRSLHTPAPERLAANLFRLLLSGSELADPAYSAKWSVLARKRYCGLLLSSLYRVASEQDLDMTAVLAHRLLLGWTGRSVSNRVLLHAFGQHDRTAAEKSADWPLLDRIVDEYGESVRRGLIREKERVRRVKDLAWTKVKMESH